jgi:hypothetical protein
MKNLNLELLKLISDEKITYLSDIKKHINIDKRSKFKYCYIPFIESKGIREFISKLDDNSFYTVIPFLSIYGKNEDPHIILSKQILITNYSNPLTVINFLNYQLDLAYNQFQINSLDNFHYLIFKYKKIIIEI